MLELLEERPAAPIDTNSVTSKRAYQHVGLALSATFLAACGGGGSGDGGSPAPVNSAPPSEKEAKKFVSQALLASTPAAVAEVQQNGFAKWIDAQFLIPATATRWQWLIDAGFNAPIYQNSTAGFDQTVWKKLISSPDELRQRMTLALSEIIVLSIDGLPVGYKQFAAANYLDILEANAFGNFRTLLDQISTSLAMGVYLTFRGNQKANATTGAVPDENYARELMQLFTIGLYELNLDGTLKLANGVPQETYDQADVSNLARVFTGWDYATNVGTTPDRNGVPMVLTASKHSPEAKVFLNTSIAAGTDAVTSMKLALDHIFSHANVGPFIGKQLIQRFVTSNPSPGFVSRVAQVFNNNGSGVKGDLKAVLKAILTDVEATTESTTVSAGRLREPVLRFIQWARIFAATSNAPALIDQWKIGNLIDPSTKLGQSPGHSPSVFNFFRPGYIPPASQFATLKLTAPEFQITNESSVVGYLNFMQGVITNGIGDLKPNYLSWLPKASDGVALVAELNSLLAGGAISSANQTTISNAINAMPVTTDAQKTQRVQAAVFLVMASPEYLIQK
jgi:uncharacterized protein (DUF1800 family)